jgi:hypothetical protein
MARFFFYFLFSFIPYFFINYLKRMHIFIKGALNYWLRPAIIRQTDTFSSQYEELSTYAESRCIP